MRCIGCYPNSSLTEMATRLLDVECAEWEKAVRNMAKTAKYYLLALGIQEV